MKTFRTLIALSLALLLLLGAAACGKGTQNPQNETSGDATPTEPPLDYTTTVPNTAPGTTSPAGPDGTQNPPAGDTTGGNSETTQPPVINEAIRAMTAGELVKHNAEALNGLFRYMTAQTDELSVMEGPSNYSYRFTSKKIVDCDDDAFTGDIALFRYFHTALTTEQYGPDPAIFMRDQVTILNNTVWSAQGTEGTPWKSTFALNPTQYDPIRLANKGAFAEDLSLFFSSLTKNNLPDGTYTVDFDGANPEQVAILLSSFQAALIKGINLPSDALLTPSVLKGTAFYDLNGILTRVELNVAFTVPYGRGTLTVAATSVRVFDFSGTVETVTVPEDKDSYLEESKETTPIEGMILSGSNQEETHKLTKYEETSLLDLFGRLSWEPLSISDYVSLYYLTTNDNMYIVTDEGVLIDHNNDKCIFPTEANQPDFNLIYQIVESYYPPVEEEE